MNTKVHCQIGNNDMDNRLHRLLHSARKHGADRAVLISTGQIRVDDRLAALCRAPNCPEYGLAASCPPHVGGPDEMRGLLDHFPWAIFLTIDVETEILISDERVHVFRLLHEIVVTVERNAVANGFSQARGFAGGSCKKLFCEKESDCRVVGRGGSCRHLDLARPSMSGFGIDVGHLMKTAGDAMRRITRDTSADEVPSGSVAGLVLVG